MFQELDDRRNRVGNRVFVRDHQSLAGVGASSDGSLKKTNVFSKMPLYCMNLLIKCVENQHFKIGAIKMIS